MIQPDSDHNGSMNTHEGQLVASAQDGDVGAAEELIASIQDRIYRLSLRMVTRPADAEDVTQEILMKILARLSTFDGHAKFPTWAHRVAVNHLLDRKKTAVERMEITFEMYGEDLQQGRSAPTIAGPDAELLAQEVRLGCTQAMLLCLDREHRIAYVLGEVFMVSSADGAYVCDVPAATYRKRLSRARDRVRSFINGNCGLVNPEGAACRCARRINTAVKLGRIDAAQPALATHPAEAATSEMETLFTAASLMRSHPEYRSPDYMAERIANLVKSGDYELLN